MKLNIIRPPVLIALLIMVCAAANAQPGTDKGTQMYSQRLQEILKSTSLQYWLDLRPEVKIKPVDFLKEYKPDLRLTALDEFKLMRAENDRDGNSHNRFQQYYKGIKIEGAECIVHELKGFVKSANGRWVSNMNLSAAPSVNEAQALSQVLTIIKSKDYLWKHKDADALQKLIKEKDVMLQPKGHLVFCRKNWNSDFDVSNITLAWKFTILVSPMTESYTVYAEATSGKIIHKIPVSMPSCHTGSGATTWYGTRSFPTTWRGWPDNAYHLDNSDGSCDGRARISSRRGDPIFAYNYGDADNSWFDADGTNGYNQRAGTSTYWALINAYDFYRYNLGRLSYDGANGALNAYSEMTGGLFLSSPDNANWNPLYHSLQFGAHFTSSPNDDWNTIDIVGHEMTHGVVQFTADLAYSYESGALNESFADIFGTLIDQYGTGSLDWLMGEDRGAIRNMANPNAFNQPDTYTGTHWYSGGDWDDGGVHVNSGVQNYWFYLLSVGGSGSNDLGRTFNVSALGTATARNIAYRNLDVYLTSSSVYNDAREGAIRAAEDLYGSCSNQVIQTANAWYAVGVGYDQYVNGSSLCGNYSSSSFPYLWRNPQAINVGQTCNVSFSYTGIFGTNTLMSGTSVTLYPGVTIFPKFTAYIDQCAVAAYSLTPEQQSNTTEAASVISQSSTDKQVTKQQTMSGVSVYPNPATNYITIKSTGIINRSSCFITDVSGRKLNCTFQNNNTVDISKLSPGIYFINISMGEKTEAVKFIKQ